LAFSVSPNQKLLALSNKNYQIKVFSLNENIAVNFDALNLLCLFKTGG
jgi:hypothetical protein